MYTVKFSERGFADFEKLKKHEPKAAQKLLKLLAELETNPYTGTGHPEQLKGRKLPTWSRRITQKHRLVYRVEEDTVVVLVLSTYGHYDDK